MLRHGSFASTSCRCSSPDGISQRCPGGQLHILKPSVHLSHLFCSWFMAHPLAQVPSPPAGPPRWAAEANDPRVAFTSCEADLMRVEHLRWRLQTHLMAAEPPNYTHLHPYLGEATPPRHLRLWQRSCRASFCRSAPVSSGCRVGDPEPAAAFHLLARSTCFGLRSHLSMHRHRFYPAGSKNLSHLTQPLQQLLMLNRRATSPPVRTPSIRRLTADIWTLVHPA